MARRSKAQDKALGALLLLALVIGTPIYVVMIIGESIGWPGVIAGSIALLACYIWYRVAKANAKKKAIEARRTALLAKYGDEQVVERIMNRVLWQGESREQLNDSLGAPVDTDEKVLKKCRREVWKYYQTGVNRFGLRITLEDGVVVGWDEKL